MNYATLLATAQAKLRAETARARIQGNTAAPTLAEMIAACRAQAVAAGFTVEDAPVAVASPAAEPDASRGSTPTAEPPALQSLLRRHTILRRNAERVAEPSVAQEPAVDPQSAAEPVAESTATQEPAAEGPPTEPPPTV